MTEWIYPIVSVLLVALIALIGITSLAFKSSNLKKILLLLVSLAVGALFGDAFIHLLPKAFANSSKIIPFYVLLGIILFFVLEKFVRWRHCHDIACKNHKSHIAAINLIGDGLHNFIDGILIATSYMVSFQLGIATTLAVILHEVPQEMGDFGVLVHAGYSVKKAVAFNFVSALLAVAGTVLTLFAGFYVKGIEIPLVAFTAGGFIYLAGSDLIPELQHEQKTSKSALQFVFILIGMGLMYLIMFLE